MSYWEARLASTEPGDHLLVADAGAGGRRLRVLLVLPPAAGVRPHPRGLGLPRRRRRAGRASGRLLYDELLGRLRADGVHQVLAVIALPNDASEALHRACGFERVGAAARGRLEVRPLDRHRPLGAHAAVGTLAGWRWACRQIHRVPGASWSSPMTPRNLMGSASSSVEDEDQHVGARRATVSWAKGEFPPGSRRREESRPAELRSAAARRAGGARPPGRPRPWPPGRRPRPPRPRRARRW